MKKQTIKAWALVSALSGKVRFDVGYPTALCLFPSRQIARLQAETWAPRPSVERVRVTIEYIKPKNHKKSKEQP